jgi:hypothetical protein
MIVAKTDVTEIAAMIVTRYARDGKEVKVINNHFNRIAFNNKRLYWSECHVLEAINEKDEQFRQDYNKKLRRFEEQAAAVTSKPIQLVYSKENC